MKRAILVALALMAAAAAQEKKEAPAVIGSRPGCCVQRIYPVKNADPQALYRLVYTNPGGQSTPVLRYDDSLRVISIYGTTDEVNSILSNLKQLDVPPAPGSARDRNVELTMWLVAASNEESGGDAVPTALQPALKAVQDTFGYKSFKVLDSGIARSREGVGFDIGGNATPPSPKLLSRAVANYQVRCRGTSVDGNSIRLDDFNLAMQVPFCNDAECRSISMAGVRLNSTFDIREGQKVVIGKSKLDGTDKALIVVLSGKVVE
jgi:hypothetical protein